MAVVVSDDKILVPCRKAPCITCREVTYHANVAGSWLCIKCGRDLDSPQSKGSMSGELIIRALGRPAALKVIEALRSLGEARAFTIAKKAGASPTGVADILRSLYEADLAKYSQRDPDRINSRKTWRLNRANPALTKILALLEEIQWTPGEPHPW